MLSSNGRQSSSELRIKKALCYARVSTRKQKDDLERQSQVLQNFCQANGMSYEVILDIGSGLNYKKQVFSS